MKYNCDTGTKKKYRKVPLKYILMNCESMSNVNLKYHFNTNVISRLKSLEKYSHIPEP